MVFDFFDRATIGGNIFLLTAFLAGVVSGVFCYGWREFN